MVVDTSAFVAVLLQESRASEFLEKMSAASSLKMSAVSHAETSMVLYARAGQSRVDGFDALIQRLGVQIISVSMAQALATRSAFARFGKGQKNRAKLNLGDLFSYALAIHLDEELLFQGTDFVHTDVKMA